MCKIILMHQVLEFMISPLLLWLCSCLKGFVSWHEVEVRFPWFGNCTEIIYFSRTTFENLFNRLPFHLIRSPTAFKRFICLSLCSCRCSISKYVDSFHHARRIYLTPSAQLTSYLANLAQIRLHGNNFHFDISIDVFACIWIQSIRFIPFSFCSISRRPEKLQLKFKTKKERKRNRKNKGDLAWIWKQTTPIPHN